MLIIVHMMMMTMIIMNIMLISIIITMIKSEGGNRKETELLYKIKQLCKKIEKKLMQIYLQFKDQHHFIFILIGIVKIN